jgi:hypothetical protein
MRDCSASPFAVIPAQAGIQLLTVGPDLGVMDSGLRRNDGGVFFDRHREIVPALVRPIWPCGEAAPAFFALRASHFSLLAQRKVTKRNGTPHLRRRVASVPGRITVLGGRADTTSCRDGARSASMPHAPLRSVIRPALLKGTQRQKRGGRSDALLFSPLRERRAWCRAQGMSGQDVRESAAATGCRVGTDPEHGTKAGNRRSRRSRGACFLLGTFLYTSKEKYLGPEAEKGRYDFAVPVNQASATRMTNQEHP